MDPQPHGYAPFTVEVRTEDDMPVVAVGGEIDSSNEHVIQAEVGDQLGRRPPLLVVDLMKVTFLGSAGIRVLISSHMTATNAGTRLLVVADHHAVLRPLEVSKVDQVLELVTDHALPLSRLVRS